MAQVVGPRRLMLHLFMGLVILATSTLPVSLPDAEAAPKTVDPREIALTPTDLPAGFSVDPGTTGVQQIPILERRSAAFVRGFHLMPRQVTAQWHRRTLIEQDVHSGRR